MTDVTVVCSTFAGTMTVRKTLHARTRRVPECDIFTNKISLLPVNNDYVLPHPTWPVKGLFIAVPQIERHCSALPQNAMTVVRDQ